MSAGFTGQEPDPATGLVWSSDGTPGGRWYDPAAGRFLSEDVSVLEDGPNPYRYAGNAPYDRADPSGRSQATPRAGTPEGPAPATPAAAPATWVDLGLPRDRYGLTAGAGGGRVSYEPPRYVPASPVASSPPPSKPHWLGTSPAVAGTLAFYGSVSGAVKSVYTNAVEGVLFELPAIAADVKGLAAFPLTGQIPPTQSQTFRALDARDGTYTGNVGYVAAEQVKALPVVSYAIAGANYARDPSPENGRAFQQAGLENAAALPGGRAAVTRGAAATTRSGARVARTTGFEILHRESTPDAARLLQNITDQAVADLAADPTLARSLLSRREYRQLSHRTRWADARYGNAVERQAAAIVEGDPRWKSIFDYRSGARGPDGRYIQTPDFFGFEGQNLRLLEITTPRSIPSHLRRPYGPHTDYIIHPGLPDTLVFPR